MADKTAYHAKPDSAYSWMVMVAVFFAQFCAFGMSWTTGIFYVIFLDELEYESPSQVALAPALNSAMMYAIGPVAGVLINLLGCRVVGILGGLLGGIGIVISLLSTNVHYVSLTFGAMTGTGFGLNFLSGVTALSQCFDKNRALAISIATSGIGMGVLLYPILIRYLCAVYGWRGAILITGGISFHLVVCAAAFPSWKQKHKDDDTSDIKAKKCKDMLHISMFKNLNFDILCVNGLLFCFGASVVFVHLAAYAESLGIDEERGAMLFSVIGVSNFLGRFVYAAVTRIPACKVLYIHAAGCFLTGLPILLLPLLDHYIWILGYCVLFGVASATIGAILPLVVLEFLGDSLMANGYGNLNLVEAVGQALGAPVAGYVYFSTKVYAWSLYLGGGAILASFGVLLVPIARQYKQSSNRRIVFIDNDEDVGIS